MNQFSTNEYVDGVLASDRRMLAKTITLIESSLPEHQMKAKKILDQLLPHTGRSIRLGITGVPGVGKSTFVESLGVFLVEQKKKVAVLAVDPSSTRSGGSILGDKTRMEKLSVLKDAFIRPSPSSGTLGGVTRKTRETMLVCEAAGFDVVLVETVGVGQSEVQVSEMVDFFMVLMLAGAGDELQGIKKGILEIADSVIINKADGDNVEKAQRARQEYEMALHFLHSPSKLWTPPVQTCSALNSSGVEDAWNTVLSYCEKMKEGTEFSSKRTKQALSWMWSMVEDGLKDRFHNNESVKKELPVMADSVKKGLTAPTVAAEKLLSLLDIS